MTDTPDILKKILDRKQQEIKQRSQVTSLPKMMERAENAETPRGFVTAIETKINAGEAAVIAEIKKHSPSKGLLREHFIPADIATSYEQHGAACLSVLTDKYFFHGKAN